MHKIFVLVVFVLFQTSLFAQDIEQLKFDGISFELADSLFIKELSKKHWKVKEKTDNGVIIIGSYLDIPCVGAIEFAPKSRVPVLMVITSTAGQNTFNEGLTLLNKAVSHLERSYGEYKAYEKVPEYAQTEEQLTNALKNGQIKIVAAFFPKYKGFENIDAYAGMITAELTPSGFEIRIKDALNSALRDSEVNALNDK